MKVAGEIGCSQSPTDFLDYWEDELCLLFDFDRREK
jgi:hypothetical protein